MSNHETIIEEIKNHIKEKFSDEGSGHDYYHTIRVYNSAIDLARTENNVDMFTVKLASLLHDVADHKFGYTDEDRRNIITQLLKKHNVSSDIIENVVYIANNISFKGGTNKHVMQSIEGKIVQDADRLDAIGAIGIARAFTYGGYKGRQIYIPENDKNLIFDNSNNTKTVTNTNSDTISHFYEKLLLLKDKMNTESGKRKAEERHKTMEQFLNAFYKEWNGEM